LSAAGCAASQQGAKQLVLVSVRRLSAYVVMVRPANPVCHLKLYRHLSASLPLTTTNTYYCIPVFCCRSWLSTTSILVLAVPMEKRASAGPDGLFQHP